MRLLPTLLRKGGYIKLSVTSSAGCVSEISLDITDDQYDLTNSDIGDISGCSVRTPWTRRLPVSVVSRFYPLIVSRATRPRRTFSRMASALATSR